MILTGAKVAGQALLAIHIAIHIMMRVKLHLPFVRLHRIRQHFKPVEEIYEDIAEGRQFHAVYLMMLVLSALIALLGLLLNSPAVIIGAMLISPLIGPILSSGLALTLADWDLGRKAVRNIGLSVVEAVAISALVTFFSPLKEATPEIIARTSPNLMDLGVAFFSGIAGTLALCSKKGGLTVIPGVAIATAVIPPLSTVGYGLATAQWSIAGGAFMLFFTNLMAIIVSADLTFLAAGFRPEQQMSKREHRMLVRNRIMAATAVLILLSIPLMQTLLQAAQQTRMRREISSTVRSQLEVPDQTRVASVDFRWRGDTLVVRADVRTTNLVEPPRVKSVEEKLAAQLGRTVDFNIQQVRVATATETDVLSGALRPSQQPEPEPPPAVTLARAQEKMQALLEWLVKPLGVESVRVSSLGRQSDGVLVLEVLAHGKQPTEANAWSVIAAALAEEMAAPVQLRGRLVVAADPEHVIRFRGRSVNPDVAARRKLQEVTGAWNGRKDLRINFRVSEEHDKDLTERRLAALSQRFPEAVSPDLVPLAGIEADVMQFQVVQSIEAAGLPRSVSAPAAATVDAPAAN